MIRITIPGTPVAKGRPRITTIGGKPRAYTPAKTVSYEAYAALCAGKVMDGREPLDGPLDVLVYAYFPIPKSWSKADRTRAETSAVYHTKRPDADNCLKALGDGLNGIVWTDDARIANCRILKLYSVNPRVEVQVSVLAG